MTGDTKNIPFVALRHRDFRLLWLGQLVSQAGTTMQVVAINWHISVLTNYNPLALGLVGLSRVVPIVVFSLIGGAVVVTAWKAPLLRKFEEEDLKQANAALVAAGK